MPDSIRCCLSAIASKAWRIGALEMRIRPPNGVPMSRINVAADSNEGGHLFQSDRGHHSNLMAASLVSSRGPVLVMSWRRSPGQVVASGLLHLRPRFLPDKADRQPSFHWRC